MLIQEVVDQPPAVDLGDSVAEPEVESPLRGKIGKPRPIGHIHHQLSSAGVLLHHGPDDAVPHFERVMAPIWLKVVGLIMVCCWPFSSSQTRSAGAAR